MGFIFAINSNVSGCIVFLLVSLICLNAMHIFSSHTKYMVVRFCFPGPAEYFVMGVTAKFGVIDDGETLFSVSTTTPRQRAIGGMSSIHTWDTNGGRCIFIMYRLD